MATTPQRFVLALGESRDEVLGRDDVEIVELRSTFVLVKATNVVAAQIRRDCGRFITLLDGEQAATAAIRLFDRVPPRISD
jgi:hypothetical protein